MEGSATPGASWKLIKMGHIGVILGIYWDNGKENGNYRHYRDAIMAPVGAVSALFCFWNPAGLGFLWWHQRQELEDQPSLSDPEQAGSHATEFGLLVHQDHS